MKFTYSIPLIGSVEIELKGYPEKFYLFLEKKGEVKRLQRLDHLGVLQDVFMGMRHTRWDYTVAMLYLIQQFSRSKLEGLSAGKKINNLNLSGRDMMQLLALTSNIGHIPGTFGVEKGIMRYLVSHNNTIQKLINIANLPNNDDFNKIDYINLNKLFMLVKLEIWISDTRKDRVKNLLTAIKKLGYEWLISGPKTEHRKKIHEYFNFIRRVSYQLFDCLYANLPLKIDYIKFINQLPKLLLRKKQLNTIIELTDHYTRIIYKQIYHSDKACEAIVNWTDEVHKYLAKQNNALEIIKKWLNSEKLSDIHIKPLYNTKEVFSCTLPHKFGVNFLIDSFKNSQVERFEINMMKLLKRKKVLILYVPRLKDPISETSEAGDLLFKIYANKGDSNGDNLPALGLVLVWIYMQFRGELGVGVFAKAVMEKILQLLSPVGNLEAVVELSPNEFYKDEYNFLIEDRIQILSAGQRKEILDNLLRKENTTWESELKEQFAECKVLKDFTRKKWGKPHRGIGQYWIIVPGRLKYIVRNGRQNKCEFDGALLRVTTKKSKVSKMNLYLIEVKTGRSTSSFQAKTELERKLKKLKIENKVKIRKFQKKNAYAEIRLV